MKQDPTLSLFQNLIWIKITPQQLYRSCQPNMSKEMYIHEMRPNSKSLAESYLDQDNSTATISPTEATPQQL